ncbi:DUF7657 domain-containing protein [Agromyces badenianii]|uniref:DUF7657 domain-containing protein n=1 Tax=Agromyces badenianii TaxID=2080742 RepID=UPI000D5986AB|nr:hypothetical protein [Agromyces badenianii]PWC03806.1 hypothetical protein DCE94_06250 [Agromyces badenianii]
MTPPPRASDHGALVRIHAAYLRIIEPTALGLPNWRVVSALPILLGLGFIFLVAFGVSGTSSGVHWMTLGEGADPRLIAGTPRAIRSDEWLVQQGWVVSQYLRGFPAANDMFPGGTDMTVLNELPSWDWSSVMRPHVWGYLFFGLDVGVAWHWWLPGVALIAGSYLLLVTLLPRRPITAALISVGLFFTPFVQWWYTPGTLWSAAWPLLAMAGTVWILVESRRWVRYTWAAIIGYTAVTLAMGLYIPFIVPGLVVYLAFFVGYLLRIRPWTAGWHGVASRVGPLAVAGFGALAITGAWALTHRETFDALLSTVYPGQRFEQTGGLLQRDPNGIALAGAPWSGALKAISGPTLFGPNSSESSTVILMALFLLPALVWFAAESLRKHRPTDWLTISCVAVILLILAFLYVPGWDAFAHLLQLDRVPAERWRLALAVLVPLALARVVARVDAEPSRRNWILGLVSAGIAAASIAWVWSQLRVHDPATLQAARYWVPIAALTVASVGLLFVKRLVPVAALAFFTASLLMGWGVNPTYRGVVDLSRTEIGQTIDAIDEEDPGAWVAVGSAAAMSMLTESDLTSFSGIQSYPSTEMWELIDPTGRYEDQWNRLGHIHWVFDSGEPSVSNPQADVIVVTFDACAPFAQHHVEYVISDAGEVPTACLAPLATVPAGSGTMRVFEVVPPR